MNAQNLDPAAAAPAAPGAAPGAAAAAAPAPAAVPVFVLTPGKYNAQAFLDFSQGSADVKLFNKGSSALPIIYDGTNLEMFLNAFDDRAQVYSRDNILTIPTVAGPKNLVREYGQITKEEVVAHVKTYASAANRQAQNCVMMYICLRNSVAATKLADLEGDLQEFTQQGPTFLKYIIKEANNGTTAAAISVSMNMIELDKTMNSLQHDVKSFNNHCQGQFRIRDQLGQPISNTDGIAYLAKGYKEVPSLGMKMCLLLSTTGEEDILEKIIWGDYGYV